MTKSFMAIIKIFCLLIFFSLFIPGNLFSQQENKKPMKEWTQEEFTKWYKQFMTRKGNRIGVLGKPTAGIDRKAEGIHDGNRMRTLFTNFGSIGKPRSAPSVEWPIYSGISYAYEFGPVIGAMVQITSGDSIPIVSDALIDGGERANPALETGNVRGWEPVPGLAAPKPNESPAKSNFKSTWPAEWTEWPGLFGKGVISADQESYWIMDDRFNDEYQYYPVDGNDEIRGLGLTITCRGLQYSAQVAEDIIFFLYEIKLREDAKPLDKVVLGMVGDPHVGGAADYNDDFAGFDQEKSLVYAYDKPGSSNDYNLPKVGWLGFQFLESPSNHIDGIDNDNDGMVDESRNNGIDDDGDWDATDEEAKLDVNDSDGTSDDVGTDGVPGTNDPDGTEGNGIPDPGEPDYDWTDIDESDEIGLTSMSAPVYGTVTGAMDDRIWQELTPGNFGNIEQDKDNLFIFGSGYFKMNPGDVQRFSVAILVGEDEQDMRANAEVAYRIYRRNFQFTKAPDKPKVSVVPGDQRVKIYWDSEAENSNDPLLGRDFEGYAVYRSEDKGITWGKPVTDNRGVQTYWEPVARYDKIDEITGPHELGVNGIHMFMGEDTGIKHFFVDTNVTNGMTYHYAVTSYDKGSTTFGSGIVPVECSKIIGDMNVVEVTPNAPSAGYEASSLELSHSAGISNARVIVDVMDQYALKTNDYTVGFNLIENIKKFSVINNGTNQPVLSNETFVDGTSYIFDGIKLTMFDWDDISFYSDESYWISETCNYRFVIGKQGVPNPADYEIRFFDQNVSTAINNIEVPFEVWNITTDTQVDFGLNDTDASGGWSGTKDKPDFIAIREDVNGVQKFTWKFTLIEPDTVFGTGDPPEILELPTPPVGGDILHVSFTREFKAEDKYLIKSFPPYLNAEKVKSDLANIAVVPNPYIAAASWEEPTEFRTGRGDRRIDFIHLPTECKISIFTMSGELVKILEHKGVIKDGTESWNLKSRDGLDIAYGIYVYVVEMPEGNKKTGKFAIIK